MDKLILIKPITSFADQIVSYRQEFLDCGSSMDGCGSLRCMPDPNDWLDQVKLYSSKNTVPEDKVQSTQFICIRESDNRLVGMIQVRHYFNEYLEKYAGNIGYSIRPSERRKGYGTRMLRLVLPFCREIGLDRILIACLDTNDGSRKIILANGGIYDSTVFEPDKQVNLERYWITL